MKKALVIFVTAITLFSCSKGVDPYISKSEVNGIVAIQNPAIQNVAFIYNNDVYYMADFDKTAQRITTTATTKRFIKMSHDHFKFAYLNGSGYIEIVDNQGKLLTTLTQYISPKSFDWSSDDKTLYILYNGAMYYYGAAMALPEITYPGVTPGFSTEIVSVSVSLGGDFAYIIHYYAFTYGDKYKLVIKPAGSSTVITYDNNTIPYTMNYVGFSANQQDMIVGYRDATASLTTFERVEFFSGLNAYPTFSIETSEMYGTPVYNSKLKYFVCGYLASNATKIVLSALSTTDNTKNKIISQYNSTGNGVYTDWK